VCSSDLHTEGNADAHIKAAIIGSSRTVFFEDGKILFGTWQGIFFCEFDGPRRRKVLVKVLSD
jgi:secondary thiamine-phosphate synthase enzyme